MFFILFGCNTTLAISIRLSLLLGILKVHTQLSFKLKVSLEKYVRYRAIPHKSLSEQVPAMLLNASPPFKLASTEMLNYG